MRTNVIHRQERGSTQLALKASVPLLRIRITRVRIGVKGHLRERIRRRKWIHLVAESKRIFHWRRYVRGIKIGRSDQQYGRPHPPVFLRHLVMAAQLSVNIPNEARTAVLLLRP